MRKDCYHIDDSRVNISYAAHWISIVKKCFDFGGISG